MEIMMNEEHTEVSCNEAAAVRDDYYGWTIESPEWEITIRVSSGQDGTTVWAVILVQIDGGLTISQGRAPTGLPTTQAIRGGIEILTRDWQPPVRVEINYGA
jgi:hypothetical protein